VRCQANRRDELAEHALVCAVCAQRPSQLTSCHASAIYRDAAESWIRKFKYPEPGLAILRPEPQAVAVAMLLDAASRTPGPPPQLVIPVPLHPRRLRERGFNPAAVLARELARKLGIAYASDHLERSRDTPSQTRLSRLERRRNVSGAFTRPPADALPARVWLVDDVVTTGSTLEEAARTLRQGPDRESQLDKLTRKTIEIHAICPCRAAPR
jgi:ComF family protein